MIYAGRIVEVEKKVHNITYIKTGVKKHEQWKYQNKTGGCGTYAMGGKYLGTEILFKVYIFDLDTCVTFDLREQILNLNNKKKISPKLLDYITENNRGKKIKLVENYNSFTFDINQLDLIMA